MFTKLSATCPVCKGILGVIVPKEICSFVCRECEWIFTWDSKGKLLPPVKLNPKKPNICDCGGCQARDEKARKKYL